MTTKRDRLEELITRSMGRLLFESNIFQRWPTRPSWWSNDWHYDYSAWRVR